VHQSQSHIYLDFNKNLMKVNIIIFVYLLDFWPKGRWNVMTIDEVNNTNDWTHNGRCDSRGNCNKIIETRNHTVENKLSKKVKEFVT